MNIIEPYERRRTFVLDTAQNHMAITYYSANFHQLNISYSAIHVQVVLNLFCSLLYCILAGQGSDWFERKENKKYTRNTSSFV